MANTRNYELNHLSIINCLQGISNIKFDVFPKESQNLIRSILRDLNDKVVVSSTQQEIGDIIAAISEIIPVSCSLYAEFSETVASLCSDREYVQFSDKSINTLTKFSVLFIENAKEHDITHALRVISLILFKNTLKLTEYHDKILEICIKKCNKSEEIFKRVCTILGNLCAFSQKSLPNHIYTKCVTFLMDALAKNGAEVYVLRSLQLIILDAPKDTYDLQEITRTVSDIAFNHNQSHFRFEAVMILKALASTTKASFYSQWPLLLVNKKSIFDLLTQSIKLAKASADLLTELFLGAWSYMYIADNLKQSGGFTTLASTIGEIIDVSFDRFILVLSDRKIDVSIYSKIAKAFSVFIKGCSFDSGRLKNGYITRLVTWGKSVSERDLDCVILIFKSLLWTKLSFEEFNMNFQYIFELFLNNVTSTNQDVRKIAISALRRSAYAYTDKFIDTWSGVTAQLKVIPSKLSFSVITRLAEKEIDSVEIWEELFTYYIPKAMKDGDAQTTKDSIKISGCCGFIFEKLNDKIKRFVLDNILRSELSESYTSLSKLVKQESVLKYDRSFLESVYNKTIKSNPLEASCLSSIMGAFSKNKDLFKTGWLEPLLKLLNDSNAPVKLLCYAYIIELTDHEETKQKLLSEIVSELDDDTEKSNKYYAAESLSIVFSNNYMSKEAVSTALRLLNETKNHKLKVLCAEALSCIKEKIYLECMADAVKISLTLLVEPAHFMNLKLEEQRKFDSKLRESLTTFFFNLIRWSTHVIYDSIEEVLVTNADFIYNMMLKHEESPWEKITSLYELKFSTINSSLLEKFQKKAFPVW